MATNTEELGQKLVDVLKGAAKSFVQDNKDEALDLGEDLLQAILTKACVEASKLDIPPLSKNPTAEEIAQREEICLELSQRIQLVAAAERENTRRVAELKKKAASTAVDVASKVGSVLLGVLLSSLKK